MVVKSVCRWFCLPSGTRRPARWRHDGRTPAAGFILFTMCQSNYTSNFRTILFKYNEVDEKIQQGHFCFYRLRVTNILGVYKTGESEISHDRLFFLSWQPDPPGFERPTSAWPECTKSWRAFDLCRTCRLNHNASKLIAPTHTDNDKK